MYDWATAKLADVEAEQAQFIALVIGEFSNLIQQFPLGSQATNLEIAITGYEVALILFTRENHSENWAMTQNNLGTAYLYRIRGERAENIESAIASFQAALEVYTREALPQNHAGTQFNLGLAYRNAQQLDNAYHAFATAIDTVEFQRVEISLGTANDADKQKLAEEWNSLYSNMIEVCLELADNTQAWEYIERSKTRNLIELLTSRSLYPDGEIPTQIKSQLQQLQQEILIEQRGSIPFWKQHHRKQR
ncbi:hypothetical protein [Coleofasciculus sp. G2-EDA-02]|uniref:hypothetical protein n=1 Tax=Coleofasciculus sp. G2-EDA-02 TaxID=3069529 RepID=UPI0032FAAF90